MHHIVALLLPAWGHTASYLYFAQAMLQSDPTLVVTVVQHALLVPKIDAALTVCTYDKTCLHTLLRRSSACPKSNSTAHSAKRNEADHTAKFVLPESPSGPFLVKIAIGELLTGWLDALPKLLAPPPSPSDWPAPKLDFLIGGLVLDPTLQIVGPDVKILAWWSSAVVAMHGHLSEHDVGKIAEGIHADEIKRDGRSLEEIRTAVAYTGNGTDKLQKIFVKITGAPNMYDHEVKAHATGPPEGIGALLAATYT